MGKKIQWNADRVVSISAIIVSVATLIMILYQTNLMRQEQRASVMPSLKIGYNIKTDDTIFTETIAIRNRGLGPAFVYKFLVKQDNAVHEGDLFSYFDSINDNKNALSMKRMVGDFIIPKNEEVIIYEKETTPNSDVFLGKYFEYPLEILRVSEETDDKAIIEIYYKNVYGDRWVISSNKSAPEALD